MRQREGPQPGRVRRGDAVRRILDRKAFVRLEVGDPSAQQFHSAPVAFGIGFAGAHVVRGDDRRKALAKPRCSEGALDLVFDRRTHDREGEAGSRLGDERLDPRAERNAPLDAAPHGGYFFIEQLARACAQIRSSEVFEDSRNALTIRQAEIAIVVGLLGDRDTVASEHLGERREVKRLREHDHTVEVEENGPQHGR